MQPSGQREVSPGQGGALTPVRRGYAALRNSALAYGPGWLTAGLVLLVCVVLYRHEVVGIEQRLREREAARVGVLVQFFGRELGRVMDDLRTLASSEGLQSLLDSRDPADLDRAIRRAVFFSQLHPSYDQIRYLDEHGQEILRVNRKGEIVPSDQLQNKAGRAYFQQVQALDPGEIHISAFDLNMENNRVEVPFKPMLRFSTPVFDANGNRRGAYVINYLGRDLLVQLQEAAAVYAHRLRLLNAQGYWLKAADPGMEWGFMVQEREGYSLARLEPAIWARLTGETAGSARHDGGLLTWQKASPGEAAGQKRSRVMAEDDFLIFASQVSASEWNELFIGLRRIFLIVTPVLLLLTGGCVWLFRKQQQALRALRDSEENLSVTLHSIGDAVLATDTAGKVTLMNRVAEQLTGWQLEEARGRPIGEIFNIINEETRAPAPIPVEEVLITGEIKGLANHTSLIARDGTERAIADSAAPIHDTDGRIMGVVLVFRDVTESRKAQAELDNFFNLSVDFLGIADARGYFKRISPAVTDILGWSPEEFMAKPFVDFVHPDDHVATRREVERQMVKGESVLRFENRYRHKNGSWRVLSWRSVPHEGQMYAIARDVTERRRAEDEVRDLSIKLHRRATQLTNANQELEAFSYSVSHDLRAPLRHVQGYVELLTRETGAQLSDKSRRYLQTISDAAREMGELIDALLKFSRMGRSGMTTATVELTGLVEEVRQGLEPETAGRDIRWKIAPLPAVIGDAAMLRQVLVNLLGNAVKYSRGRNPAEIEIGLAGEEEGRRVFFVRDNGAGFDMKYANKLFGVFQRLHRNDEFEGTGIGLANVQRIIIRHGGRTWAEGRVGAGATFYFTLQPAPAGQPPNHTQP